MFRAEHTPNHFFLGILRFSFNDGISSLSDSDPPNGDAQSLLDFVDVILSFHRQVLKLAAVGDGLVPARHGDVFDLNTLEAL